MNLKLTGKSVLITGASQGIGEGLAEGFAKEGANLHLTARRGDVLNSLAERLRNQHNISVNVYALDLTGEQAPESLADAVGDVDILVNNAGVIPGGDLQSIDAKSWRQGWNLKVLGAFPLNVGSLCWGSRREYLHQRRRQTTSCSAVDGFFRKRAGLVRIQIDWRIDFQPRSSSSQEFRVQPD